MWQHRLVELGEIFENMGFPVQRDALGNISNEWKASIRHRFTDLAPMVDIEISYSQAESQLRALASSSLADADTADIDDVLAHLERQVELGKRGEQLVDYFRNSAIFYFDKSGGRPGALRNRIATSNDLDFLFDLIAEYKVKAQESGGLRSSRLADLPSLGTPQSRSDTKRQDIADSARKMFGDSNSQVEGK